jgi:hypothetical protein
LATICYLCDRQSGAIPGLIETRNPLATCAICGVLVCNGHGKRDPNVRRFQCVLCVPALLVASAMQHSELARQMRTTIPVAEVESWAVVHSVDELLERWPEFSDIVSGSGQQLLELPTSHRALWRSLPDETQHLIDAAIVIARRLEFRREDLPPVLVSFMNW